MSLLPTGRGRRVLAAIGIGGVLLAALLRVAPGAIPVTIRRPLTDFGSAVPGEAILWILAAVAGLYALVRAASGRRRPALSAEFGDREGSEGHGSEGHDGRTRTTGKTRTGGSSPGGASPDGVPTVGTGFDRAVSAAGRGADDLREAGRPVRERLRATATAVLVRRTDASSADARAAVAAGEWTDDRVAAAFLGGESAPDYVLPERVRGWVRPGPAFRDRVERTVAAIEAVDSRRGVGATTGTGPDGSTADPGGRSR